MRLICNGVAPFDMSERGRRIGISNEVWFNFGKNVDRNVFDQNRASVALGRDVGHQTRLEVGFMEQNLQHWFRSFKV